MGPYSRISFVELFLGPPLECDTPYLFAHDISGKEKDCHTSLNPGLPLPTVEPCVWVRNRYVEMQDEKPDGDVGKATE